LWLLLDIRLDLDAVVDMLFDDPYCMLDGFSRLFRSIFRTKLDLRSPRCLAVLAVIALLARLDTSRVEARHASLRRLLIAKGATWIAEFANLSADWLLARARILLWQDYDENDGAAGGEDTSDDEPETVAPSTGGPHRAFVAEFLRTHPQSEFESASSRFEAAHKAYRDLKFRGPPEEMERYKEIGRAMTVSNRQRRSDDVNAASRVHATPVAHTVPALSLFNADLVAIVPVAPAEHGLDVLKLSRSAVDYPHYAVAAEKNRVDVADLVNTILRAGASRHREVRREAKAMKLDMRRCFVIFQFCSHITRYLNISYVYIIIHKPFSNKTQLGEAELDERGCYERVWRPGELQ